jgi:hypothetical protein
MQDDHYNQGGRLLHEHVICQKCNGRFFTDATGCKAFYWHENVIITCPYCSYSWNYFTGDRASV